MLCLQVGSVFTTSDADLGADLDPDHRLLLRFVQNVGIACRVGVALFLLWYLLVFGHPTL